jgi:hypothetical protein
MRAASHCPCANVPVRERHERVLPAVQQQERHGDVGEAESPRPEQAVVFPPALDAGRQPVLHRRLQVGPEIAVLQHGRIDRREQGLGFLGGLAPLVRRRRQELLTVPHHRPGKCSLMRH